MGNLPAAWFGADSHRETALKNRCSTSRSVANAREESSLSKAVCLRYRARAGQANPTRIGVGSDSLFRQSKIVVRAVHKHLRQQLVIEIVRDEPDPQPALSPLPQRLGFSLHWNCNQPHDRLAHYSDHSFFSMRFPYNQA
jgi:hypothetical protein